MESRGGAAAAGGNGGQGAPVGILEGFLNDLRGEKKNGRSNTNAEKKAAGTEKSGKVRDTNTETTVTSPSTATATTTYAKVSPDKLGRLNAANASIEGLRNASAKSTVGQLYEYMKAANGVSEIDGKTVLGEPRLQDAAAILAGLANKEISVDAVKTLNEMLEVDMTEGQVNEIVKEVDAIKSGSMATSQ